MNNPKLNARRVGFAVQSLAAVIWVAVFIFISHDVSFKETMGIYCYMGVTTFVCVLFHRVPVIKMVLQDLNKENIFHSELAVLEAEQNLERVENTFGHIGSIVVSMAMLHAFIPQPSEEIYVMLIWLASIGFTVYMSIAIVRRLLKDSKFLMMEMIMQPGLGIANFLWVTAVARWLFI